MWSWGQRQAFFRVFAGQRGPTAPSPLSHHPYPHDSGSPADKHFFIPSLVQVPWCAIRRDWQKMRLSTITSAPFPLSPRISTQTPQQSLTACCRSWTLKDRERAGFLGHPHSGNAGFAIYLRQPLLSKCFPRGSGVKNPPPKAGDVGDLGSIPELGRCPGEGNGPCGPEQLPTSRVSDTWQCMCQCCSLVHPPSPASSAHSPFSVSAWQIGPSAPFF